MICNNCVQGLPIKPHLYTDNLRQPEGLISGDNNYDTITVCKTVFSLLSKKSTIFYSTPPFFLQNRQYMFIFLYICSNFYMLLIIYLTCIIDKISLRDVREPNNTSKRRIFQRRNSEPCFDFAQHKLLRLRSAQVTATSLSTSYFDFAQHKLLRLCLVQLLRLKKLSLLVV